MLLDVIDKLKTFRLNFFEFPILKLDIAKCHDIHAAKIEHVIIFMFWKLFNLKVGSLEIKNKTQYLFANVTKTLQVKWKVF